MSNQQLGKRYNRILFQKGQTNLVSEPFYVGDHKVAVSAYAAGTGLPPGARITFQELIYIDGGRQDGTLCTPGHMNGSQLCDYKPLTSCGCEPTLTERHNYIQLDRGGWFRAVYSGPSRASVMVTAQELAVAANTGCCVSACCPIEVDLIMDKSSNKEVYKVGEAGSFKLTLRNLGPEASKGGSVKDALPAGLTYGTPIAVYAGGAIGTQPALAEFANGDWHYALLPVGGQIEITVPFVADGPGSFRLHSNSADIMPGIDELDTNWVNNKDTVFYTIVKQSVDVNLTKTVLDADLKEGDPFTFTITVSNTGDDNAAGTIVKDVLPTDLGAATVTVAYTGGAAGGAVDQGILAAGHTLTSLPSGATAVYTITGTATKAGQYSNYAYAKVPSNLDDVDPSNNGDTAVLKVEVRTANLSIEKTVADSTIGETDAFSYTLTVNNAGPDVAHGMTVKDVLPAGLTVASITGVYSGGAAGGNPTVAQLAAGYAIPTMPVGGNAVFIISGTGPTAGLYVNTATVKPQPGTVDDDLSDNSALATLQVSVKQVDVSVTKVADAESYNIGDDVTYTITVMNAGPDGADGTTLIDVLPPSLLNPVVTAVYAGGAVGATPTPAQLAAGYVIPTLPAGGTLTLTIVAEASASGLYTNTARVVPPANRNDVNPGNGSATSLVTIKPPAIQVCGGGDLDQTTDEVLIKGSLKKCVNGVVVDLDCGDIVKVITCPEVACEINTWATQPGGASAGAGICIAVGQPQGYLNGVAVVQGRDLTNPIGNVPIGNNNPPAFLQHSYTNNTTCPVLYEAELVGTGNIFAWGQESGSVSFTFNVGPTLGIPYPATPAGGSPQMENTVRSMWTINGVNEPSGIYSENSTGVARYRVILAPGQSTTAYGQWWCAFQEATPVPGGQRVIHGHMAMAVRITKGAAWI